MKQILTFFLFVVVSTTLVYAQETNTKGILSGNLQVDGAYYTDSLSQSQRPEGFGINSYANFNYNYGKFTAGLRFELYQPPLMGYDTKYQGMGIPYKYLSYKADELEFTVGNFYEQYGSGMILRSYEEKTLGYDNALEGVQLKYNPFKGVYLKGLFARQRNFWDYDGLVRGIDGEIVINDALGIENTELPYLSIGGSFVSKYQDPQNTTLNLPGNVAAGAGRASVVYKGFNLSGEYAYKINDPSADNNYTYKNGQGLLINATYSTKGFGVYLTAKRLDNMYFRSNRNASATSYLINNPPAIAQEHTYSLSAMYPFATQANGEMGLQSQVSYKFKKNTPLGGKYGTKINVSLSKVYDIRRDSLDEYTAIGEKGTLGYNSNFFALGDHWYTDFNIKLDKKFSNNFKGSLTQMYQEFDNNIFHVGGYHHVIYSHITVADMTYKINNNNAVRLELQHLYTKNDKGNWAMAMLEYTVSPHWFFVVWDQVNYGGFGNTDNIEAFDEIEHFYNFSFGYTKKANRIQLSYGKQREGVVCAGGVCRYVPAYEGFMLSISSTF
ncbi:MAG: hypothetical protein JXR60_12400 [Bacteroidales bacterium]|nr:hypothetical protein [Bacteroidales bacterium]